MKIEASSYLSSAAVQPGLGLSWSKTPETVFSRRGSYTMRVFFYFFLQKFPMKITEKWSRAEFRFLGNAMAVTLRLVL